MDVINRIAVNIKPKEPYVKWANHVATTYESIESINSTDKVILLPEDSYSNQEQFLEENWRRIFELELESWTSTKRLWPEHIDFDMFKQWFDLEFHALVIDFGKNELSKEPYN